MWNAHRLLAGALVALAFAPFGQAQKSEGLLNRLQNAEAGSALDAQGLMPWHLKLDVQLFDDKGKPTENGTIEEWWVATGIEKVTFDFPSYTGTEIHNQDGYFRTGGAAYEPGILQDVLEEIVHPLNLGKTAGVTPDLRKQKFGKVQLDCIMMDEPIKNVAYPPLGLFPTYCLDEGEDNLRITTALGSVTFVRSGIGHFQQRSVAVDFVAQLGVATVAKAHVSTLATIKAGDVDLHPSDQMVAEHDSLVRMSGGVNAGALLNHVQPVYPAAAKANRVQGQVGLHAVIGRDGRIRSLHLISTPDPDLAIAAIADVRQWTYRPFLLKGVPTEVDMTISVNFAIN